MPTINVPAAGGNVTINGAKPFKAVKSGGPSGAYDIVDSTGAITNPILPGQASTSVFADIGKSTLDAIITAFNA